jgi:hypothetical protein
LHLSAVDGAQRIPGLYSDNNEIPLAVGGLGLAAASVSLYKLSYGIAVLTILGGEGTDTGFDWHA